MHIPLFNVLFKYLFSNLIHRIENNDPVNSENPPQNETTLENSHQLPDKQTAIDLHEDDCETLSQL